MLLSLQFCIRYLLNARVNICNAFSQNIKAWRHCRTECPNLSHACTRYPLYDEPCPLTFVVYGNKCFLYIGRKHASLQLVYDIIPQTMAMAVCLVIAGMSVTMRSLLTKRALGHAIFMVSPNTGVGRHQLKIYVHVAVFLCCFSK